MQRNRAITQKSRALIKFYDSLSLVLSFSLSLSEAMENSVSPFPLLSTIAIQPVYRDSR